MKSIIHRALTSPKLAATAALALVTNAAHSAIDPETLVFANPPDGAVHTAPAVIRVELELYRPTAVPMTIDLYANGVRAGVASLVADPDPTQHGVDRFRFAAEWRDISPGVYALTARANLGRAEELVSGPTRITVLAPEIVGAGPQLMILSPREGEVVPADASLQVRAVGIGRFGGILDTELFLDGRSVAESRLVFIRSPEADEPVQHAFELTRLEPGEHTLVVREIEGDRVESEPVRFRVGPGPGDPVPSLCIVSPAPGALFQLGEPLHVEAVGIGREGGITHVELLLDDTPVGESRIVFIRAPSADEPVFHQFAIDPPPGVGNHQLKIREMGNPQLASKEVPIVVVAPSASVQQPLLRLAALEDGTLLLMVKNEEEASRARIEVSTDLVNWQPVTTAGPALRVPVVSLSPGRPLEPRYYRAVSEP